MVRAPCCEKLDLKKGPWTADEDEILVAHIVKHGHGNWRALPKQAGLLRCGKSCRLRWMNYLRPDIKRGSFTVEEEEMIITMHENLGNKWSVIAAKLPGRTDNEIKNVWHTHLKKRLNPTAQESKNKRKRCNSKTKTVSKAKRSKLDKDAPVSTTDGDSMFSSPAVPSCSNFSCTTELYSITGETAADSGSKEQEGFSYDEFLEIDESFWTEELCVDSSLAAPELPGCDMALPNPVLETLSTFSSSESDVMDFWLDVFIESGGLQDFP